MTISNLDSGPSYYRHMQFASGVKVKTQLPNLFGVGPGRSGTSFLYGLLANSPDVLVSPVKETNYFGILQDGYRKNGLTIRDYERLFAHAADQEYKYIAEVTPVYLFTKTAMTEIKKNCGMPKIIVTLRHPIIRTHSQFKHHSGTHKIETFDEYCQQGLDTMNAGSTRRRDWFAPATSMKQSLYAGDLSLCWQLFGRERVLVLIYEELDQDPEKWVARLSEFLEADIDYTPQQANRYRNASPKGDVDLSDETYERVVKLYSEDVQRLTDMNIDTSYWSF